MPSKDVANRALRRKTEARGLRSLAGARLTTPFMRRHLRNTLSTIYTKRLGGRTAEEWDTFRSAFEIRVDAIVLGIEQGFQDVGSVAYAWRTDIPTATGGDIMTSLRELQRVEDLVIAPSQADASMLRLSFAVVAVNGGAVIRSRPREDPDLLTVQGWMFLDSLPVPLTDQQIIEAHEARLARPRDPNTTVPPAWAPRYRGVTSLDQQVATPGGG